MFLSHKTVRCLVLKHKRKMLIRYKIRLKLICIMTWRRKYDMPLSELIKANIFLPTDICVMQPRCGGHVTEYMLRMEMYCDQPIDRFSACGADSRGSIKGGTMAYSICTFEVIVWYDVYYLSTLRSTQKGRHFIDEYSTSLSCIKSLISIFRSQRPKWQ